MGEALTFFGRGWGEVFRLELFPGEVGPEGETFPVGCV